LNPDMTVAARVRPMLEEDLVAGFPCAVFPRTGTPEACRTVDVHDLYNHPSGIPVLKVRVAPTFRVNSSLTDLPLQSAKYEVDELFNASASTQAVFEGLVVNLMNIAQKGGIGTLFAYGQTGSGKTFTIGQLQQFVASSLMDQSSSGQYEIYMTIFDLAGNTASNLLNSRKRLPVLQDADGNTQLGGAREQRVETEEQMLSLVAEAASYRQTASTFHNDESSRSHAICRYRIRNHQDTNAEDGLLYLIDLAGSEAVRDIAKHGDDRMRETREINISLSVLKDCIREKAKSNFQKSRPEPRRQAKIHVPIRRSALTRVLKHVFDPQSERACKTAVIACVNPCLANVTSSKSTLRYAEMLRAGIPTA